MRTLAISPWGNGTWGNTQCKPFNVLFKNSLNPFVFNTPHDLEALGAADGLLLWGGEDIHPSLYGATKHPKSEAREAAPSVRDKLEWMLIQEAVKRELPIIGVCRGAQMLCAAAGGSLYQHVSDHGSGHLVTTYDGKQLHASASHHQMMNLEGTEHEILAWAGRAALVEGELGGMNLEPDLPEGFKEPEVVYFPEIKAMAIQPHPEWEAAKEESPFNDWLLAELKEKLCLT
jgi:hypothetical protein